MAVRAPLRLRQILNAINLSTLLGLLVARIGHARVVHGPDGLLLARDYRLTVPRAPAFTIGNVILVRLTDEQLAGRPTLLRARGAPLDAVRLLHRTADAAALLPGRRLVVAALP